MSSNPEASIDPEHLSRELKRAAIQSQVYSAWDLSSCGLGIMSIAASNHFEKRELSDNHRLYLTTYDSNFLKNSYTRMYRRYADGSYFLSPNNAIHRETMSTMKSSFVKLQFQALRAVMAQESGLNATQSLSHEPITQNEIRAYLTQTPEDERTILLPSSFSIQESLPSAGDFFKFIFKSKGDLKKEFFIKMRAHLFSEAFRPELDSAILLKLSAMLTVIDQVSYDASVSESKIQADTLPSPVNMWEKTWSETFNQKLPTFKEISLIAQQTLKKHHDRNNYLQVAAHKLDIAQYLKD